LALAQPPDAAGLDKAAARGAATADATVHRDEAAAPDPAWANVPADLISRPDRDAATPWDELPVARQEDVGRAVPLADRGLAAGWVHAAHTARTDLRGAPDRAETHRQDVEAGQSVHLAVLPVERPGAERQERRPEARSEPGSWTNREKD